MLDYLPRYYDEIKEIDNIISREADEVGRLDRTTKDVLDQLFIGTATWGIPIWERIYGIKPDNARPLTRRRTELKAKMRGHSPISVPFLQNLLETFDERMSFTENFEEYSIVINVYQDAIQDRNIYYKVRDFRVGYPFAEYVNNPLVDLSELTRTLRMIIPAHINIAYFYITADRHEILLGNYGKADIVGYLTVSDFRVGSPFVAYRREVVV